MKETKTPKEMTDYLISKEPNEYVLRALTEICIPSGMEEITISIGSYDVTIKEIDGKNISTITKKFRLCYFL